MTGLATHLFARIIDGNFDTFICTRSLKGSFDGTIPLTH